jgi:hypothetical protein
VGAPGRDQEEIMMRPDRDLSASIKIPIWVDNLIMLLTWG